MVRVGRYGPYLTKGDGEAAERASVPEDMPPDELTVEKALELLAKPSGDRELGVDPETGEPVTLKIGRYGPYIERGFPADGRRQGGRPRRPGPACSRTWTRPRSRSKRCCRC